MRVFDDDYVTCMVNKQNVSIATLWPPKVQKFKPFLWSTRRAFNCRWILERDNISQHTCAESFLLVTSRRCDTLGLSMLQRYCSFCESHLLFLRSSRRMALRNKCFLEVSCTRNMMKRFFFIRKKIVKNRFFQSSSNFEWMVPIGFGPAQVCYFDLQTALLHLMSFFRKVDFLPTKRVFPVFCLSEVKTHF